MTTQQPVTSPVNKKDLMRTSTTLFLIIYHIVVGLLAIHIIYSIWPGAVSIDQNRTIPIFFGLFSLNLDAELTMILIVIISGVIGAFIQSLGSIAFHQAKKDMTPEWTTWYITRPFIGAGLALAIYLVLRAGFTNFGTDAASLNLFGTAAIAVISGMFTDKATQKLKEVANTLLKTEEEKPKEEAELFISPLGEVTVNAGIPLTIVVKPKPEDAEYVLKIEPSSESNNVDRSDLTRLKYTPSDAVKGKVVTFTFTLPKYESVDPQELKITVPKT